MQMVFTVGGGKHACVNVKMEDVASIAALEVKPLTGVRWHGFWDAEAIVDYS